MCERGELVAVVAAGPCAFTLRSAVVARSLAAFTAPPRHRSVWPAPLKVVLLLARRDIGARHRRHVPLLGLRQVRHVRDGGQFRHDVERNDLAGVGAGLAE